MYFEAQVDKELRPIQFFENHKEMEMNFRRVLTALAVLALFAGLASAQVTPPQNISCSVNAVTNPSIRAEGLAEHVGDIQIVCTGVAGSSSGISNSNTTDRTTITVNYGVPIAGAALTSGVEAVLTVDEPTTQTPVGYGPAAAYSLCTAALNPSGTPTSCPAFPLSPTQTTLPNWVVGNAACVLAAGVCGANPPNAPNVYQGVLSGSSNSTIIFYNVPAVPPGAAGVQRVYRITNVRVTPSSSAVTATVSAAPSTGGTPTPAWALSLTNSTATVATPAASIVTSLSNVTTGFSLCTSPTLYSGLTPLSYQKANAAILTYKEGFANAFKPENLAITGGIAGEAESGVSGANGFTKQTSLTSLYAGGLNAYNTESMTNFGLLVGGVTDGLSNSGTRLKAVFSGLAANVTYYVSASNVATDYASTIATLPAVGPGDATSTPFAVLIKQGASNETAAYAAFAAGPACANGAGPCGITTASPGAGASPAGIQVYPLTVTSGTGEAIWEITNTKGGSVNTYNFALFAVYTSATQPLPGNTATVTLGYAPTTAASGAASTFIPRFAAPSAAPANFLNVVLCQTSLLFPYVTNATGYETGMAIDNTASDPFGTVGTTGSCNMYFYGSNQPAGPIVLTSGTGATAIAPGAQIANTASGLGLVNFTGYAVGVCTFQYAHGFAFVQTSKQTLGMGYLPLVMVTNSRAQTLVGEQFTQ
jgi:hypothetical protein